MTSRVLERGVSLAPGGEKLLLRCGLPVSPDSLHAFLTIRLQLRKQLRSGATDWRSGYVLRAKADAVDAGIAKAGR